MYCLLAEIPCDIRLGMFSSHSLTYFMIHSLKSITLSTGSGRLVVEGKEGDLKRYLSYTIDPLEGR